MRRQPIRFYPSQCRDVATLSLLLDQYLALIAGPPFLCSLQTLSYNAGIEAATLNNMAQAHHDLALHPTLTPQDFHLIFSHLMFRYPTVKIYQQPNSMEIFFEM